MRFFIWSGKTAEERVWESSAVKSLLEFVGVNICKLKTLMVSILNRLLILLILHLKFQQEIEIIPFDLLLDSVKCIHIYTFIQTLMFLKLYSSNNSYSSKMMCYWEAKSSTLLFSGVAGLLFRFTK